MSPKRFKLDLEVVFEITGWRNLEDSINTEKLSSAISWHLLSTYGLDTDQAIIYLQRHKENSLFKMWLPAHVGRA